MATHLKKNKNVEPNTEVAVISCCIDDWGGSEELWARSIPLLMRKGINITVIKKSFNLQHPEYGSLVKNGVHFLELVPKKSSSWIVKKISRSYRRLHAGLLRKYYTGNDEIDNLSKYLSSEKPTLVIISQSINFDGLVYARQCLRLHVPYLLIVQKAVDFYWPQPSDRAFMAECYQRAQRCFFVSKHNKNLTEEQFGIRLQNSCIVSNPIKIPAGLIDFPSITPVYKLACVARLFVLDKGQDMLLRILAQPKWRTRPVKVSFIGTGVDEEGLRGMAKLLQIENVEFLGQVTDISKVWVDHHALVLPSRSEGLPLSILEAMAAGRPAIVSKAGGNAEIVEDEVTGFVGEACEYSFEDAMERAWNKRNSWADIGLKALMYIRNTLPANPEIIFTDHINEILYEKRPISFCDYSNIQQG